MSTESAKWVMGEREPFYGAFRYKGTRGPYTVYAYPEARTGMLEMPRSTWEKKNCSSEHPAVICEETRLAFEAFLEGIKGDPNRAVMWDAYLNQNNPYYTIRRGFPSSFDADAVYLEGWKVNDNPCYYNWSTGTWHNTTLLTIRLETRTHWGEVVKTSFGFSNPVALVQMCQRWHHDRAVTLMTV